MKKGEAFKQSQAPDKAFRSELTWLLYESRRWYPLWVFVFAGLASFLLTFRVESTGMFIACIIFCLLMIFMVIFSPCLVQLHKGFLIRRRTAVLASLVSRLQPGLSVVEWDTIACELNAELYDEGVWHTPYAFFNGEYCRLLFRLYILKPYYENDRSDIEKNAERQCALEYMETIRELFEGCCKDNKLQLSPEFSTLPRDSSKSKLTFNRGFFKSFYFYFRIIWIFHAYWIFRSYLNTPLRTLFSTVVILGPIVFDYHQYAAAKFIKLGVDDRMRILADILVSRPENDDDWSELAGRSNQRLRAQGTWTASQEFFYDCEEYKSFFRNIARVRGPNLPLIELVPLVEDVKNALMAAGSKSLL